MTKEEIEALNDYFSALIDEKIERAFGRDPLYEVCARTDAEKVLDRLVADQVEKK